MIEDVKLRVEDGKDMIGLMKDVNKRLYRNIFQGPKREGQLTIIVLVRKNKIQ